MSPDQLRLTGLKHTACSHGGNSININDDYIMRGVPLQQLTLFRGHRRG